MKRDDWVTDIGTAVVGAAAAVLTFTTLRDLAEGCGITGWLAWLVPVTVDAAGIIAARVWLRGGRADVVAFARTLAWVCIAESIVGNAGQHYMTSLEVTPPWWVVVLVSAVPPATLGAVVHLGHLRTAVPDRRTGPDRTGGLRTTEAPEDLDGTAGPDQTGTPVPNVETGLAVPNVETGPDWTDPWDRWAGPAVHERTADERTAVADTPVPVADQQGQGETGETDPMLPQVIAWARTAGLDRVSQRAIRAEFNVGGPRSARLVREFEEAVR